MASISSLRRSPGSSIPFWLQLVLVMAAAFGRIASAGHGYEDNRIKQDGGSPAWGLPDAMAVAGKLFEYRVVDGVQGESATNAGAAIESSGEGEDKERVRLYQAVDGEVTSLPDWMYMDYETGTLQGVPPHALAGSQYNIVLETPGAMDDSTTKDEFNIKIIEEKVTYERWSNRPSNQQPVLPQDQPTAMPPVRCLAGSPITTATVVFDADDSVLGPRDRVRLIHDVADHFRLPATFVRLRSPPADRPLLDFSSALVAGPGDSPALPRHPGLLVEWDVGCGNVRAELMPSLELLETTAANGRLGKAARQPVVGWHITNRRHKTHRRDPKHAAARRPWLVQATATPTVSGPRPTSRPGVVPTSVLPAEPTRLPMSSLPGSLASSSSSIWAVPTRLRTSSNVVIEATVTLTSVRPVATATIMTPYPGLDVTPSRVADIYPSTIRPDEPEEEEGKSWSTESPESAEWATTPEYDYDTDYYSEEPDDDLQPSTPVMTTARPVRPTTLLPTTPSTTTTTTRRPTSKATRRPPKVSAKPPPHENQPPRIVNPISRLEVAVGDVLWFVVPIDTFSDAEDGSTNNLTLLFMTLDDEGQQLTVPRSYWIQLNETTKTLVGIPMESDVGKQTFVLAAVDSGNKIVPNKFEVDVKEGQPLDRISHEFGVTLDINYREFLFKVERRMEVASKIASAFGDSDPSRIRVTSIAEGSVKYSWTNNTLPAEPCPEEEIKQLTDILIDPETGSASPEFVAAMHPYPVVGVRSTPMGSCAEPTEKPEAEIPPSVTPVAADEAESVEIAKGGSGDSLLFLLIVVAAVVLGLLFIVLIVICVVCCCRNRRAAEKERRQREEELSCANKGIPVIFAEELADDQEDDDGNKTQGTASPVDTPASTLKRRLVPDDDEGRPAVPPPQYPRSDPASRTSTLRSDYKAPLLSSDDEDGPVENGRGGGGGSGVVGTGDTLPPYRQMS